MQKTDQETLLINFNINHTSVKKRIKKPVLPRSWITTYNFWFNFMQPTTGGSEQHQLPGEWQQDGLSNTRTQEHMWNINAASASQQTNTPILQVSRKYQTISRLCTGTYLHVHTHSYTNQPAVYWVRYINTPSKQWLPTFSQMNL